MEAGDVLLERFELVRHIGRGGIGDVWLTADLHLEREPVAIKVLKEALQGDRRAVSDLKREVLLTRKLRHEHILGVYTFWESKLGRFITMEYIEGRNLADAIYELGRPFTLAEILPWIDRIGGALDYAHSRGVLHRDVKPGNILLNNDNDVFLADFGIARTAREVQTRLTGELTCGTLMYISPEQLLGEKLDGRSDLYSFAATVYELLSGRAPFYTGSIVTQIQFKPAPPIGRLDTTLNEILLRALSKRPADRQENCAAFVAELRQAAASLPDQPLPAPHDQSTLVDMDRLVDEEQTRDLQVNAQTESRVRLGSLLLDAHVLNQTQLDTALKQQSETGQQLGRILVDLAYVTEIEIAEALARQLNVSFLLLEEQNIDPAAEGLLSREHAESRRCIPIQMDELTLTVAMTDPLDFNTINELESTFGRRVALVLTTPTSANAAIERIYGA